MKYRLELPESMRKCPLHGKDEGIVFVQFHEDLNERTWVRGGFCELVLDIPSPQHGVAVKNTDMDWVLTHLRYGCGLRAGVKIPGREFATVPEEPTVAELKEKLRRAEKDVDRIRAWAEDRTRESGVTNFEEGSRYLARRLLSFIDAARAGRRERES